MKKTPPLQLSIFLLLAVFVLAGTVIEQNSFTIRQDLTSQNVGTNDTIESQRLRDDTTIAALASESKSSKAVHGQINEIIGSKIAMDTHPTALSLESNTYVSRNGFDTAKTSLRVNDYVWATSNDGKNITRITAISQNVVTLLLTFASLSSLLLLTLLLRFIKRNAALLKHKLSPKSRMTFS